MWLRKSHHETIMRSACAKETWPSRCQVKTQVSRCIGKRKCGSRDHHVRKRKRGFCEPHVCKEIADLATLKFARKKHRSMTLAFIKKTWVFMPHICKENAPSCLQRNRWFFDPDICIENAGLILRPLFYMALYVTIKVGVTLSPFNVRI